MRPKVGKSYVFVRAKDGEITQTKFTRHGDGSAGFDLDGFHHSFDGCPDAWKDALAFLDKEGFKEIREAKSAGLIPEEWDVQD